MSAQDPLSEAREELRWLVRSACGDCRTSPMWDAARVVLARFDALPAPARFIDEFDDDIGWLYIDAPVARDDGGEVPVSPSDPTSGTTT